MNGGSRLIKSMDESFAASRRTSCSRWDVASLGSTDVLILNAPFDAAEHLAASSACPPLSGLMYQLSVGTAEPPPPHAAVSDASTTTASAIVAVRPCATPAPWVAHTHDVGCLASAGLCTGLLPIPGPATPPR